MLTIRFDRLGLAPGDRVLDVGAGFGRHVFECARRGAGVVAAKTNFVQHVLAETLRNHSGVCGHGALQVVLRRVVRVAAGFKNQDRVGRSIIVPQLGSLRKVLIVAPSITPLPVECAVNASAENLVALNKFVENVVRKAIGPLDLVDGGLPANKVPHEFLNLLGILSRQVSGFPCPIGIQFEELDRVD